MISLFAGGEKLSIVYTNLSAPAPPVIVSEEKADELGAVMPSPHLLEELVLVLLFA